MACQTLGELDVLLALCKSARFLEEVDDAKLLLLQIRPYIEEAHNQVIAPSPFLRSIEPSPWEALSYHLVSAALALGKKHPSLHALALESTTCYLRKCLQAVSAVQELSFGSDVTVHGLPVRERLNIAALSVSLLGFLRAASSHADFYSTTETYHLVAFLREVLTESFMVSVEGVFSSIRTAGTGHKHFAYWKTWVRHYAVSGRPLGAMLLHRGLVELLVSSSSLRVTSRDQLSRADLLDIPVEEHGLPQGQQDESITVLMETLADTAAEEIRLLDDGADYLQLGSTWQQHLAFSVKAHALTTFRNCLLVNESIADLDTLISWLEDTMADAVQMADENLAATVLRSMAILAKVSPAVASTLSRSLPRFIVQSGIRGETVTAAARTLAVVLQLLSQDAIITGLYSLGNVLSAGSSADKSIGAPVLSDNSSSPQRSEKQYGSHPTGSAISLDLDRENDSGAVYGSIVRAIVGIASSCQDDKITALAQSILLQKLGRIDLTVDLRIVTETTTLATSGGPSELRSLLRLYSRISHDSAVRCNTTLLVAVGTGENILIAVLNSA